MKRNIIVNLHVVKNPQWFESVILYLKSAYKIVPLSTFENENSRKSLCAITFDDGDLTFYNVAFPILEKHNVPATIFVSPQSIVKQENFWFQEIVDYDVAKMAEIVSRETKIPYETAKNFGLHAVLKCFPIEKICHFIEIYQKETNTKSKEFRNMDLEKIREIQQSGLITIGAHTLMHPILANETAERSEMEIVNSVKDLEKLLGQEVRYFAYPNGTFGLDFGKREMKILRDSGIKIAVSTKPSFVNNKSDKMAIPRKGITYGNIRHIKLKIFLGEKWNLIKNFRKLSEAKKRKIIVTKYI
ncbi:MAG: polysaccharide deacetylase family protein [Prevotellaceae bacterium]|jgi:peptidoglycan/xylan/chitin deacetylase (PgdA/CDA1 family)|nr:polysaccharide deacetylase family protein [Prevotellaceae bacterium]